MKKSIVLGIIYTLTAALMVGAAVGQTAPSAKPQATPAAKPSATSAPAAKPAPASALPTAKDKASYAIGMNVGTGLHQSLSQQSVDVDNALLLQGFKDALSGGKTLMTEQEASAVLTQLTNELRAKQEEKMKLVAENNKKEGEAFLAANKTKEGVIALPSGLQYKILSPGTGAKPTATDTVSCNYRGTFINGKEFDSNAKSGKPVVFPVSGGIIKGWSEALQLMPVGSKWQLWVPSDLAYGPGGNPRGGIEPNTTLVFEVELVSIETKPEPKK